VPQLLNNYSFFLTRHIWCASRSVFITYQKKVSRTILLKRSSKLCLNVSTTVFQFSIESVKEAQKHLIVVRQQLQSVVTAVSG